MSTITTRSGKGSPLTHDEVDSNFTNLNTDKYESGDSPSFAGLTVASDSTYAIDVSRPSAGNTTLRITGGSTAGNDSIFRADIGNTTGTSAVYFGDSTTNGIGRIMYEHNGDYMRFYTSSTEKMRIDSSGNVGIGTTSPFGKFHVSGGRSFFAANSELYAVGARYSNAGGSVYFGATDATSTPGVQISAATGASLLRITSAGNVGIGTSSPTVKLHVSSTGTPVFRIQDADGSDYYAQMSQATGNTIFDARFGASNGSFIFRGLGGGTADEYMRIRESGYVGIGTSSPATALDVTGTVTADGLVVDGTAYVTTLAGEADTNTFIRFDGSDVMVFRTGNAERMRISSTGNVGIGTTTSSGALTIDADSSTTNNRALHLEITDDDPTAATTATYIDYNISGATATGGDTNHVALRLDTDSTATGGNTTDEHRVYGIYNTVDVSGDSDAVYGLYNDIRATHSAGTMSVLYGNYTLLEADNSGGTVSTATANRNLMYVNGTGSTSNAYANTNITLLQNPSTVTNAIGGYNEVQLESNSTVSTVYGVRSIIDENGGNSTNEYLFHASYEGTPSGTGYGLYINNETKNYISGNVGIGTNTPVSLLHVKSTIPVVTADSLGFASAGDGTGFGIYRSGAGRIAGYTWTITNKIRSGGSSGSDYQTDDLIFNRRATTTDSTLTEAMRITSAGYVGIGTTSPLYPLNVSTTTGTIARFASTTNTAAFEINAPIANYIALKAMASDGLILSTNNTEAMRLDISGNLKFNSGYGSVVTAYGCRAWVNFNGTGTVSIRESGNVSSITDSGTGNYTVNFTTSMPDVNYSAVCSGFRSAGNEAVVVPDSFVTGGVGVNCTTGGGGEVDFSKVCVAVFR